MRGDEGQRGSRSPSAYILCLCCRCDGFSGPHNTPEFSSHQLLVSGSPVSSQTWAVGIGSLWPKTSSGQRAPGFGPETSPESLMPTSRGRKGSHVTVFKKEGRNSHSPFLLGPWRGPNKVRSQGCFASCQAPGLEGAVTAGSEASGPVTKKRRTLSVGIKSSDLSLPTPKHVHADAIQIL